MIVAFCGRIGSGKGTLGEILVERGYTHLSFASSLKDAVSSIFKWDRALLEGDTKESREFRETVDEYWTSKFGLNITPRYILQQFGTEVMRNNLLDSIWVDSLRLEIGKYKNVVISDVRFLNELKMLHELDAKIVCVERGSRPEWYDMALDEVKGRVPSGYMAKYFPDVHISEWAWLGSEYITLNIQNDGTIEDLESSLNYLVD
jgi:hypothetical protein